jgi:DNA-directed RNA polymerase specialized sigma24 family protein
MTPKSDTRECERAHGAQVRFPETSWTLLRVAREGGQTGTAALADFGQRYYRPAYAYILAIVKDQEEAKEITQGFFEAAVLSGRLLAVVDQTKGSFRPYLKQALRNYVIDCHRKELRQAKRMPQAVRPDQDSRGWEGLSDAFSPPAESAYHTEWVRALLEGALERVRRVCEAKGQMDHFELFIRRYLSASGEPPAWRDLGMPFDLDEKAARSRTETVARHFRLVLREMLVIDIGSENGADEEIATLLGLL